MSLQRHAAPTPRNLRARLTRIRDAAENLDSMACRWNPKGRYFTPQREMIAFARQAESEAARLLEILSR